MLFEFVSHGEIAIVLAQSLQENFKSIFAYCFAVRAQWITQKSLTPVPLVWGTWGWCANLEEWGVGGKGGPLGHLLANVGPNNALGGQCLPQAGIWCLFQSCLASGDLPPKCLNFCMIIWAR